MEPRSPNLQNHEYRLRYVEKKLSELTEIVAQLHAPERDSSADLSIRPDRVALRLRNIAPYAVVMVVGFVVFGATVAVVSWLLR